MIRSVFIALLVLGACPVCAQETSKVMIVGVFHFTNPRADAVKTDQIDVTTAESQRYLDTISHKIAEFKPTAILQEFTPDKEPDINAQYQQYLDGNFELGVSEAHQLGFRIGRASSIDYLHGINEWGPKMKFVELQKYMTNSDPVALENFQKLIGTITEEETQAHASMTLEELLIRANKAETDKRNKAIYLSTNAVGAGDGFVGADAAAAWWNRNFRMFANIQKHAKPGTRLIVIVGGGHAAILRDLAQIDANMIVENVMPYLRLTK